MAREFDTRVQFFGIAWKTTAAEIRSYYRTYDVPYPSGVDASERIFAAYRVPYQPATVLITRSGGIQRTIRGEIEVETLRTELEKLAST